MSPSRLAKKERPKDKRKSGISFSLSAFMSSMENLDINSILSLGILLLKKLLKKIGPRHLLVCGVVGLKDPCATGQFIGFYEAAAYITGMQNAVNLAGDFNQKTLDLDLNLAGGFAIASLLWPFIWFLLQKPVRNGIKIMKKTERAIT